MISIFLLLSLFANETLEKTSELKKISAKRIFMFFKIVIT